METQELITRFKTVTETRSTLLDKKVRAEERHKTELERLESLVKEITAKGYDPQKLAEILEEKTAELNTLLEEKEAGMKMAAEKLQALNA